MAALLQFNDIFHSYSDKCLNSENIPPLILFGAGFRFSTVEKLLTARNIAFVVTDNDEERNLLSPQAALDMYKDSPICISVGSEGYYHAIYDQLINMAVPPEKIIDFRELVFWLEGVTSSTMVEVSDMLADQESKDVFSAFCDFDVRMRLDALRALSRKRQEQYFDEDIIKLKEDETFIDGGGYTGDTLEAFIDRVDNRFRSIHSFEPSKANIKKYNGRFFHDTRINIHPSGLGSEKTQVRFNNKGASSLICDDGEDTIQIEKLDDILAGKGASFIKMDIEGAEVDALKGAEHTIRAYKPKLAICVYHRDMDVFHIIELLRKYVSSYTFYLRHYSRSDSETVLYATAD